MRNSFTRVPRYRFAFKGVGTPVHSCRRASYRDPIMSSRPSRTRCCECSPRRNGSSPSTTTKTRPPWENQQVGLSRPRRKTRNQIQVLLRNAIIELRPGLLGCEIIAKVDNDFTTLCTGEAVLAALEALLATSCAVYVRVKAAGSGSPRSRLAHGNNPRESHRNASQDGCARFAGTPDERIARSC
jgi:hypothetical protein